MDVWNKYLILCESKGVLYRSILRRKAMTQTGIAYCIENYFAVLQILLKANAFTQHQKNVDNELGREFKRNPVTEMGLIDARSMLQAKGDSDV